MGYVVGLLMNPDQITREEWAAFYDEAVLLLGKFRWGIRFDYWLKEKHKLLMTTHRLEAEDEYGRHFVISGDSLSGKFADKFIMYRDLNVYIQRYWRMVNHSGTARPIYLQGCESIEVFKGKTQGYPYHKVIWAIVALAETRFPDSIMATGALDLGNWEEALNWANQHLVEALLAPMSLDIHRLWPLYAAHYSGEELVSKVSERLKGRVNLFRHLSMEAPELITCYIHSNLRESDGGRFISAATIGATCWMRDYLNGVRDLGLLLTDVCLSKDGPQYPLDTVLMSLDFAGFFHEEVDRQPESGSDNTYSLSINGAITIITAVTGKPTEEVGSLLTRIHTDQHSVRGRANSLLNFNFHWIFDHDNYDDEDIIEFAEIFRELKEQFDRGEFSFVAERWIQSDKPVTVDMWRDIFMNTCERLEVVLSEESWKRLFHGRNPDVFAFLCVMLFTFDQDPALSNRFRNRLLDTAILRFF